MSLKIGSKLKATEKFHTLVSAAPYQNGNHKRLKRLPFRMWMTVMTFDVGVKGILAITNGIATVFWLIVEAALFK